MKKNTEGKKCKLWVWITLGVVVLAAVATAAVLLMRPAQKAQEEAEVEVINVDLYWNVDRDANTDPNTGLTTREPSADGVYRILFAHNGEQKELPVKDKKLVEYIDTMDVMNLTLNGEGYVTEVKSAVNAASVLCEQMYIQKVTKDTILINSSLAMTGKQITLKVTDYLKAYNMSDKGEFIGQEVPLEELQMLDTVSVYGSLAPEGKESVATHIFVTKRWESGKVYWRVNQKYDSKTKVSTREPDESGIYTIPFYCDGETVDLKFKDKTLVDLVDYTSSNSCYFGFEFDEEGCATKILDANKATHTVLQCDRYDIVELNDDGSYVATDLMGTLRRSVEGVVGKDCAIYDISPVAKSEGAMNRKLDSLQLHDRVYIWTDTVGNPVLIYVTARRVDSPAYYNPDPQYDSEAKKTTRTPNADGYYEIELLEAGKTELQTFYVKDVSMVNTIDKAADLFVGLKITEGNIVEYVYGASSVFGNSYFCRGYVVKEASSAVVILKSSSGKSTKNGVLATGCKIWNVSDNSVLGEETIFQPGDVVYAMQDPCGEIVNAYIVSRAQDEGNAEHPQRP